MLEVNNLNKGYLKKIISHFSYRFEKGKIYCITGPSGCGKTTLLSILSGTKRNYIGDIFFNNQAISNLSNYSFNHVSYVSQKYQLFDNLTALENVLLPLEMIDENINKYKHKSTMLFKQFNVINVINEKVKNLSGGEKQRVAIIRSLLKPFDILLLDEPTSALDETSTNLFFDILNSIKKDKIIIMVSHNIDIINKSDEIVNIKSNALIKINKSRKQVIENKIKFKKINFLHKKIFTSKKILNYFSSTILTMGLLTICLSSLLSSFISNVVDSSFSMFNTNSYITFKSEKSNEIIDFSNMNVNYNYIYYEGIEPSLKNTIKSSNLISYVDFNYYDIDNINFIYDNYLSTYKENFVLSIPSYLSEYIKKDNYLTFYSYSLSKKIKVDKVITSDDNMFYIYCNNVGYLMSFFNYYKIKCITSKYLYSENIINIYDYLINENIFRNYIFNLDIDNNIISIHESYYPRITSKIIHDIKEINNCENVIMSDFTNTFIDYNTGFLYIFIDKNAIQVIIDESINNDIIDISNKLTSIISKEKSIIVNNKKLSINHVRNENNYAFIYMNSKTFNSLNNNDVFSGLLITNNKENTKSIENVIINKKLFEATSFKVFKHICNFINIFSIILIIEAILSTIVIFSITFISKKKEISCLLDLGVYKSYAIKLLLFDPCINIVSSIFSSLVGYFLCNILITLMYNNMANSNLEISFSIIIILLLILLPFIVILPLIITKVLMYFKDLQS
ncbi:MAG: ABC transporter ATP-binding protein [Bacilli bacterium]|nr:ABC transporter ATP-binding protein [Bacilli bacterium]